VKKYEYRIHKTSRDRDDKDDMYFNTKYGLEYRVSVWCGENEAEGYYSIDEFNKEQEGEYQAQYRIITSGKSKRYGKWQKISLWKKLRS
jgi:hypothetical protein